ncbi:thioredoxin [Neorhodopirellula lusitana]|uniref:Thioredoxin n=1 Tax=Neorhodopirellula lusitana TaxID=445327 RepID=A0ABY1QC73_9BACT|nr:thioredoxin domain-containing protein [Neorhodopirellula lusitana]SMP65387.1 thioredoxin [Neorhodopirellula lusitana]
MTRFASATFVLVSATLLACVSLPGCPAPAEPAAAISPAKFDQVVSQDKLVLVKFGATWCGPCRQVDAELNSLNASLPADVEVLKIDVDENPELAQQYQISSIPRLMLVRNGSIVDDKVGYMSEADLQSWIGEFRDVQ